MTAPTDPSERANATAIVGEIRANAALVVETFAALAEFSFAFDSRSVEWLDGYINRIRTGECSEDEIDQMVSNLGSYLGEAVVAAHGGAWAHDDHGWHIRFDERNRAYPFAIVAKQLKNGPEDSIFGFYSAIGVLFRK